MYTGSCPKLLVVEWLGLSVTIRVRVSPRDREWTSFLLSLKK